jgi:hypothetical protein
MLGSIPPVKRGIAEEKDEEERVRRKIPGDMWWYADLRWGVGET